MLPCPVSSRTSCSFGVMPRSQKPIEKSAICSKTKELTPIKTSVFGSRRMFRTLGTQRAATRMASNIKGASQAVAMIGPKRGSNHNTRIGPKRKPTPKTKPK
jgi:hypothetical protein